MTNIDYKEAGVDIDAGESLVQNIKHAVEQTFSPNVLSPLGGFAGLYDLKSLVTEYENPVLVQSIDGVGTKSIVATMMSDFSRLGQDIVSATANDILVCGAKPLTLLDYVASDKLNSQNLTTLIKSIAGACIDNNISLVGGETAEMPDTYLTGEHDVVGVVTGVVDKNKIIDGSKIKVGDKIIGLPSSGLHTNGYSLARHVIFKHAKLECDTYIDDLSDTIGNALLSPHKNYNHCVQALLAHHKINGMAHISGGGIGGNLNRVLPKNMNASIDKSLWPQLPLFSTIQALGNIDDNEMYRAFNMGVGYLLVVPANEVDDICNTLSSINEKAYVIGDITNGKQEVQLL